MKGNSAQLPVDFLVGFTIFILSLIMVANFVPSLLVGLQRTTGIDFDAVAYRTGVVLVEDPGEPPGIPVGGIMTPGTDWRPWELMTDKGQVSRLGLALARDTPNILSINKINRFFGITNFSYSGEGPLNDNDYRTMLLFSPNYQYGYNVTLQNISPMKAGAPLLNLSIGQPYPAGYGYIRRYVVIKQNSDGAAINLTQRPEFNAGSNGQPDAINVTQTFWIHLDGSVLYNKSIPTPFILDLEREPLIINISGLHSVLNNSDPGYNAPVNPMAFKSNTSGLGMPLPDEWNGPAPTNATLTSITFTDSEHPGFEWSSRMSCGVDMCANLEIDGNSYPIPYPGGPYPGGVRVNDTISLSVDHIDADLLNSGDDFYITFTFDDSPDPPHTLIHGEYLYDYNQANVTQPVLSTGMLEVGIW